MYLLHDEMKIAVYIYDSHLKKKKNIRQIPAEEHSKKKKKKHLSSLLQYCLGHQKQRQSETVTV